LPELIGDGRTFQDHGGALKTAVLRVKPCSPV
jgi:hypothetical protein